jgi:hypothetical protein
VNGHINLKTDWVNAKTSMARLSRALGRSTGRRRKSPVPRKLESSRRRSIRISIELARTLPVVSASGTGTGTTVTAGATTRLAAWLEVDELKLIQTPTDVSVGTIDDVVAVVAVIWARRPSAARCTGEHYDTPGRGSDAGEPMAHRDRLSNRMKAARPAIQNRFIIPPKNSRSIRNQKHPRQ